MTQHLPDMDVPATVSKPDRPILNAFLDAMADKPEHLFMWFLLVLLMVFGIFLLMSWHNQRGNKFNMMDLITIDGKLEEAKMTRFIAFVISTWGFVFLITTGSFTEWYFMGYMAAWVGNALFNRYLRQRDKEIDKTFEIEEKAVDRGWKPKPKFNHSRDIEPYDPEDKEEGDDTALPSANMKGRRKG